MELLAPAGNFSSAVYAFSHGADAVYAGMSRLSAREAADNFSFTDLRRLKKLALQRSKRIYITLNTLVTEHEIPMLLEMLEQCAYLKVDGVIIQDLGVCRLIRTRFPSLPLHASTQLAVHSVDGVRQLTDLGFSRVVLSRELSIEEISSIMSEEPGIEYEVFVHGALCCSFSGLCLASGRLLGRSGNRGMCAQVCRTWFSGSRGRGYYFSMKDLHGAKYITALKRLGTASCKIEGRMKRPEYVGTASEYYRRIIDSEIPDKDLEQQLRTIFSRPSCDGWLGGEKSSLTSIRYPSHMGIEAGKVTGIQGSWTELHASADIALRDGLMLLQDRQGLQVPEKFSVSALKLPSGRIVSSAAAGQKVLLKVPVPAEAGTTVYKISDHALHWPAVQPDSYAPYRRPVHIRAVLTDTELQLSSYDIWRPGAPGQKASFPVTLQQSEKPFYIAEKVRQVFSSSGESLFTLDELSWENRCSLDDSRVFIPPSRLKQIRRQWYASLDSLFSKGNVPVLEHVSTKRRDIPIPLRGSLNPIKHHPVPFVTDPLQYCPGDLASDESRIYIPLNPVIFSPREYEVSLKELIRQCADEFPEKQVVLGINNIGHIPMANRLVREFSVSIWADIYLYAAHLQAAQQITEILEVPPLFGYLWLEQSNMPIDLPWPYPAAQVEGDFNPPLFISRTVFPGGDARLHQGSRRFAVKVLGEFSYVFSD